MIKTIKLDGKNNYIEDKSTGEILERFDESRYVKVVLTLNDSILTIDSSKITKQFDGQYIVQHNDDRYIIDDGYYNSLIKSGYIVFNQYDTFNIDPEDKEFGIDLRNAIIRTLRQVLIQLNVKYNFVDGYPPEAFTLEYSGNKTIFKVGTNNDDYSYIFVFDTINNMVNKNQSRKENNLTFYPFKKSMDRYGTIYLSVFCQKNRKITDNSPRKKYILPDQIIKEIIKELNKSDQYHYVSNQVKRRLVYCKGI